LAEETVYRHAVEGLFIRSLGARLTPELKLKLKEAGLDLDGKLDRGVPRLVFAKALKVASKHLYPNLDETEGFRQLGIGMIKGIELTLIGKALTAMWPLFGPERVLSRMQESFATVNNYLKTGLTTHAKNHHVVTMSQCNGNPGYTRGIIEAGLTKAGAKNLRVEPFDWDGNACSFRVQWD